MKRQGGSASDQPPVKKPDASADLRSKIGAKLQSLLNGIDTESILYAKRRKQLYEDLFGKPKYSEIIIDPTIVIKEEPDVEECSSDSSTLLTSQNFLSSAKSRLTELLNKQQDGTNKYKDSGKENTLFSNRNKSSSGKSSSLQNPQSSKSPSRLCNSLNKKRSVTNKEHSNLSSDPINSEIKLKKLVIVLEDCMNSNFRTKLSPTKHPVCNTNLEPNCVSKQGEHVTSLVKVNKKTDNIDKSSKSCSNSGTPVSECSSIKNISETCRSKLLNNVGSVLSNDFSPSKVTEHADIVPNTEDYMSQIGYYDEDESEMLDDPIIPQVIIDIRVDESISANDNSNFELENSDSDVELLCEKEPVAEVITLEDNEEEDEDNKVSERKKDKGDAAELIHECKQCGKSFRAASLLNFHIRMHGNNSSQSPSSSSHSLS